VKASGARIAFWSGGATEAGLLARQLHDAGATVTLMGGAGIAGDDFAALAGPGAEGTLMLFPRDPRQRPEAADLARRLGAGGLAPDAYAFYAYAAVEVIHQAAEAAHAIAPGDLARVMHSGMVFHTVLGAIAFDAKGDVIPPDYTLFVWRKGPGGRIGFHDLAGG
jgi:branched-chain amino acid transport system substrate-binding protein